MGQKVRAIDAVDVIGDDLAFILSPLKCASKVTFWIRA